MKFIGFAFFMLMLCQSAFSQSQKKQIETLILQIDSLGKILTKERILNSDKIKDLDTKIINIQLEVELLQTELNQSNKDLASKEVEISGNQLAQLSQEKIIRGLGSELNQIKSSLVSISDQVKIGNQIWMTKNLNVDKFRNGDPIPEAKTNKEWLAAGVNQQPAWAYYDNDLSNGEKYGKLYNWYSVNDPRGLAPEGWHVPSIEEWNTLIENLDGKSQRGDNSFAGEQLKSSFGWKENVNSKLNSGFLALPGGDRDLEGYFSSMYYHGYWWSSDEVSNPQLSPFFALYVNIHTSNSPVHAGLVQSKGDGYSVRCLKGDGVTFTDPRDAVIDLSKLNSEVNEEERREIVGVIFDVVETQPTHPGGMEGWNKYLAENMKYPEVAKKMGVQGTVILEFVITTDGSIKDVTVLRGIGGGCDEEAIRVVKNGPKWEPGKQRGEPVNTRMRLPFRFKLD